jgi:hypothetical protein
VYLDIPGIKYGVGTPLLAACACVSSIYQEGLTYLLSILSGQVGLKNLGEVCALVFWPRLREETISWIWRSHSDEDIPWREGFSVVEVPAPSPALVLKSPDTKWFVITHTSPAMLKVCLLTFVAHPATDSFLCFSHCELMWMLQVEVSASTYMCYYISVCSRLWIVGIHLLEFT